mgnify:CR=1 FL=1
MSFHTQPRETSPLIVTLYAELVVVLAIFVILFSLAGFPKLGSESCGPQYSAPCVADASGKR